MYVSVNEEDENRVSAIGPTCALRKDDPQSKAAADRSSCAVRPAQGQNVIRRAWWTDEENERFEEAYALYGSHKGRTVPLRRPLDIDNSIIRQMLLKRLQHMLDREMSSKYGPGSGGIE